MRKKYLPILIVVSLFFQMVSPILGAMPSWVKTASAQDSGPVCSPDINLVVNGGFEFPSVTNPQQWDIYPDGTAGLGWDIEWYGGSGDFAGMTRPAKALLELHRGVNSWSPQEGSQYAELDTDWFGPDNTIEGEPSSVKISQSIPTNPGYRYEIKYSFSPRPNTPDTNNNLELSWNGTPVETHSATGGVNTEWQSYTKEVITDSSNTVLAFTDLGTPDSFGTFLDNVSVKCLGPVPTPTTEPTTLPTPTVEPTEPPILTSTVTMCKVDKNQNPLEGWNLQLLGSKVESVTVLPDDLIGGSITPSESSVLPLDDYVLLASGTYKYRGGTNLETDPGYSQRLESDGFTGPYFPWINIMDLGIPGALGIMVNSTPTDWGYFSPSHQYARGYGNYSGKFSFTSLGDQINDNKGSMSVDIYKGFSGLTGENGCVTFEGVPYGQYTTDEILKQDWEDISGKGATVSVDQPEETFTLVNRTIPKPAKLQAFKVVCIEEKYLPNNVFGGNITAQTAQDWVSQSNGNCRLEQNWKFQWAPQGSGTSGSFQTNTTELGSPWTTFNTGMVVDIPVEYLEKRIETREVFPNNDYVPFSNNGNVSAEFWCTNDGVNYDNWEWLNGLQEDRIYYCVGFNALKTGSITGHKYHDQNGNGIKDHGDKGMKNWEITLYDAEGHVLTTTSTKSDGSYKFNGLQPGEYYLSETQKTGWVQTNQDLPENGKLGPITLEYGEIEGSWDFFNFKYGKISGFKIEDYDANGKKDKWDFGVKGWGISLWQETGVESGLDMTDIKVGDKETDFFGSFHFNNLGPGTYYITEETREGWFQTSPLDPGYHTVMIDESGEISKSNIFLNYKGGEIWGLKFFDINGNGKFDQDEIRGGNLLNGWKIILYDQNWDFVGEKTTGYPVTGAFRFSGLKVGTYYICEEVRGNWLQTNPTEDNGVPSDLETLHSPYCFKTSISGSRDVDSGFWFGNTELSSISGYKWRDFNGDGEWDEEEDGLEGWSIRLTRVGVDGEPTETFTGEDGYYEFSGLVSGEYQVCEESREGWLQTYPVVVEDKEDCHSVVITTPGQKVTEKNFGNFELGKVRGYKWDDDNGNREKDWGEPKLPGWTIELHTTEPSDIAEVAPLNTEITDENGEYAFSNLKPGTYYLVEVTQAPWEQTYPVGPRYHTFTISTSGQVEDDKNFGNNLTADLLVTKTTELESATPNSLVTYKVSVKNIGTEGIGAEGVTVWDDIPVGVNYHSSSPNGTYNSVLRRVTWTIPSLAVNEEWVADITVFVPTDLSDEITQIVNNVEAKRSCQIGLLPATMEPITEPVIEFCEDDPTPENNRASSTVAISRVLGEDTDRNKEVGKDKSTGSIKGITDSIGKVLGASSNLPATGRNIFVPVGAGMVLLAVLVVLNKKGLRKKA